MKSPIGKYYKEPHKASNSHHSGSTEKGMQLNIANSGSSRELVDFKCKLGMKLGMRKYYRAQHKGNSFPHPGNTVWGTV